MYLMSTHRVNEPYFGLDDKDHVVERYFSNSNEHTNYMGIVLKQTLWEMSMQEFRDQQVCGRAHEFSF